MIAMGPIKKKNTSLSLTVSNCAVNGPHCVDVSVSPNVAASSVALIVRALAPPSTVSVT